MKQIGRAEARKMLETYLGDIEKESGYDQCTGFRYGALFTMMEHIIMGYDNRTSVVKRIREYNGRNAG